MQIIKEEVDERLGMGQEYQRSQLPTNLRDFLDAEAGDDLDAALEALEQVRKMIMDEKEAGSEEPIHHAFDRAMWKRELTQGPHRENMERYIEEALEEALWKVEYNKKGEPRPATGKQEKGKHTKKIEADSAVDAQSKFRKARGDNDDHVVKVSRAEKKKADKKKDKEWNFGIN